MSRACKSKQVCFISESFLYQIYDNEKNEEIFLSRVSLCVILHTCIFRNTFRQDSSSYQKYIKKQHVLKIRTQITFHKKSKKCVSFKNLHINCRNVSIIFDTHNPIKIFIYLFYDYMYVRLPKIPLFSKNIPYL